MTSETFVFQAEINQLMSLMINTFYSNKEIFIRELIANSSDALDKIRHIGLTDPSVLEIENNLSINISICKENNTITIVDTGIGLTKADMINNLGTIAKSGTKAFMEAIEAGADMTMIGQFGVGFYSSFLVSEKVTVVSKHNDDEQYIWESTAGGSFTIAKDENQDIKRGTKIILHLKEDQKEYLEPTKLKDLIMKYSQYTNYSISILMEKTITTEVTDDEEEEEEEEENNDDDKPKIEDVDEDEEKNKKTKTVEKVEKSWDVINEEKALWLRNSEDINEDEYHNFYKHINGNSYETPLGYKHFSVEGQLDFKAIIYIPERQPFDLFDSSRQIKKKIKLYVRRVLVQEDCEDILPEYLAFVSGIIDSDDLPLNISRESLQRTQIMKTMRKNLVKRILECLLEMADEYPDKYSKFYEEFSKSIKLGIHEDSQNRNKLVSLVRYHSTKTTDNMTTLKDYISRMKEGQDNIYYITGESDEAIRNSPFTEYLVNEDVEILLMTDPIDEYVVQNLKEHDGKKLVSITKETLKINKTEEQNNNFDTMTKTFEKLTLRMKEILGNNIEKVQLSNRLVESPCCIVTGDFGWSSNMTRIMKSQTLCNNSASNFMSTRKILEINPNHAIIKRIFELYEADETNMHITDFTFSIYESGLLTSGFSLDNPILFGRRLNKMISCALGLEESVDPDVSKESVEPDISKESVDPDISKESVEPDISKESVEPDVSKESVELDVSKESVEPDISKESVEPDISKESVELDVSKESVEPDISKESVEPDISKESVEPDISKESVEPDISKESVELDVSKESVDPDVSKESVDPDVSLETEISYMESLD